MPIRDWPASERPRERLLAAGAATLSDAELVAVLLGGGRRGGDAVGLARTLLATHGGIAGLLAQDPMALQRSPGVGPAAACRLSAAVELAGRAMGARLGDGAPLSGPEQAGRYLSARLGLRHREVFAALFLDSRHRVLRCEELFAGTIDGAAVHPREVVRRALTLNAAALIVAHNHPSGVAEPSAEDIALTRRLRDALALVEVRLLDHLVVGAGEVCSLAGRGLL